MTKRNPNSPAPPGRKLADPAQGGRKTGKTLTLSPACQEAIRCEAAAAGQSQAEWVEALVRAAAPGYWAGGDPK
jgi:hypothetical protein